MENVAQALEMAFAVFIFIIGLSVSLMLVSQTRETADQLFYSTDKTNYYQYTSATDDDNDRKVGIESIIPSIYRSYEEEFGVTIVKKEDDGTYKYIARYDITTENTINKDYTKVNESDDQSDTLMTYLSFLNIGIDYNNISDLRKACNIDEKRTLLAWNTYRK